MRFHRGRIAKQKESERKDENSGYQLRIFQDGPTEIGTEAYGWFTPKPPTKLKPDYWKQADIQAAYRGEFYISTGRAIRSGQAIVQDSTEGLTNIMEKSKKLIDMRFPK